MNKKEFVNELSKRINYSIDDCEVINDILESNFFISKKNKNIIIGTFMEKFNISFNDAKIIYEECLLILKNEIVNKIKHPFKSID